MSIKEQVIDIHLKSLRARQATFEVIFGEQKSELSNLETGIWMTVEMKAVAFQIETLEAEKKRLQAL